MTNGNENFTILRYDRRWGNTTTCFDTQNQGVASAAAVGSRWRPNRVMTPGDSNEIYERKNKCEAKLKHYSSTVNKAHEHWRALAQQYTEIEGGCQRGERRHEGILESQCIMFGIGKLAKVRQEGDVLLANIGFSRLEAFRECDFLMVNAPSAQIASEICQRKMAAFSKNRELIDEMIEFNKKMAEIRSSAEQAYDLLLGKAQNLFEQLVALISALLETIRKIVVFGVKAVAKITGFFIRHPYALMIGGGIVGLGILAFIARPYIAIGKAALGVKR